MSDHRFVRMAELEIDPDHIDTYKALLDEEIAASVEREPDVLMLHAVSLRDAPHHIRILEVYASRAAYEAHIQTPHFLAYKAATTNMVASLRLLDADPIHLGAR